MLYDREATLSRRAFLRLATYGGSALLVLGRHIRPLYAGAPELSRLSSMEFDVTYRTEIYDLPQRAKDVHVWMPLPPAGNAQDVTNLTVTSDLPHCIEKEQTYGNRLAHLRTERTDDAFALEARYHVLRRRIGATPALLDAESAEKYLRLTSRVRVTDEVDTFTRKVVGDTRRALEVGEKVFTAITELLTYDKEIPGCGTGDTAWIMKHRRGKCDDYHALFMAMMVSRGIPVRWEQGFPLPQPTGEDALSGGLSGDCSGAHCWVSFYDPELGWIPVDVSEADKHPDMRKFFFGQLTPNRFQVSEGRSILLKPQQGGDALETFAFAYAEADGIPLIYDANYRNVIHFTITNFTASDL